MICWARPAIKRLRLGIFTSLGRLLRENTLRGQDRWWCLEIQLRMFSHSAVPLGGGPSSLCNNTNCFWARTALPSSILSNYRWRRGRRRRRSWQPALRSGRCFIQWRFKDQGSKVQTLNCHMHRYSVVMEMTIWSPRLKNMVWPWKWPVFIG